MDQIRKILIVILEPQDKTSTETNYFKGLKSNLKKDKWKDLFSDYIDNIAIESVKSWKISENKILIDDCNIFIKPDAVYGIVDNDNQEYIELAKKCFLKLAKKLTSCENEYKKVILPPNNMNFEYFIALHILEKSKISLNQVKINENLKTYFNKDLSKIKSDEKIFEKLFENGNNLLFQNIQLHPDCIADKFYVDCDKGGECNPHCHRYRELIEAIFKKDIA